jgi:hypothetical protein
MMDTEEPIKVEVKEEPKDLKTEAIAPVLQYRASRPRTAK